MAKTGLHDLGNAGFSVSVADICRGPTRQGVKQAWYAARHPISRRHQTLTGPTLAAHRHIYVHIIERLTYGQEYTGPHTAQVIPAQQSCTRKQDGTLKHL